MTPLLIVKINGHRPPDQLAQDMKMIADGIKKGCLILSGDCEVISFDDKGRLNYPIKREEAES